MVSGPWICESQDIQASVPKALWKWGCVSRFFLFFVNFRKWRCYKKPTNWSIFWCDISIFECKVWAKSVQIYRFWVPWSTFCMYHLILSFCRRLKFFYSISLNFLMTFFFAQPPIFPSLTPLKKFFTPLKFFIHPLKIFYLLNFSRPSPLIFAALPF